MGVGEDPALGFKGRLVSLFKLPRWLSRSSRKPLRRRRPRELRAFFSCMAWRAIPGPLSKRKRRLDSLEAAQGLRLEGMTFYSNNQYKASGWDGEAE